MIRQILDIEGAEGFADFAFACMKSVTDEGGKLEGIDLCSANVAGGCLGSGNGLQQAPQEADVETPHSRANGTVVKLLCGEQLKFCSVD